MITVHFYVQDQDGPIVEEVNNRIVLKRAPAKRYREIGLVKIDYTHRPPTDHPDDEDRDALISALEYMRAFRVEEFMSWVAQNLAAAGLNDIASTVASGLRGDFRKAGVVLFDLGALDRAEP